MHARAIAARRAPDALLLAALALAGVVMFALVRWSFMQDSWLALVAGREVWNAGLPHHESLTLLSAGSTWVDQQWLAQVAIYGLSRLGGLGLVGSFNVALVLCGLGGAAVAARRLGAAAESIMLLLPLSLWAVIFGAQVRTQAWAYPLFVLVVYLLAADSRAPSRRTYLCLPLLMLWANLHGSVTLGVGLVALRGLTIAWERRGRLARSARAFVRPLSFILAPLACLIATPYGTSVVSYYHDTLLNSSFRSSITEWQPVTSVPFLAAPFLLLAAIALWSFGRHGKATTLWERCALIALAIGGVTAVRNVDWFALAALMIVAVSIDGGMRERRSRRRGPSASMRRLNLAIAGAATLALAVSAAAALARPSDSYEPRYQRGVLTAVRAATAADPTLTVFAEDKFGDWLLWHEPQLRGRVAYDARFELLGSKRLTQLVRIEGAIGPDWKRLALGYRLLVIDGKAFPDSLRGFKAEPGARMLFEHDGSAVILRRADQAR